jgi:hypothetical protein
LAAGLSGDPRLDKGSSMDHRANLRLALTGALLTIALAGCATPGSPGHSHTASGAQGDMKDMQAMCDMHRQRMAGRSAAEQKTMMEEHMKSMSPEMQQRMRTMLEQCR